MSATIPSPYANGQPIGSDLRVHNGQLHFQNIDLLHLITEPLPGQQGPLGSPLEVVFLPKITSQITQMNAWFAQAALEVGYPGRHVYAYASKANSAEEVTHTALQAGAHYETSSAADVLIVQHCLEQGLMPRDRLAINNGFKPPESDYAKLLIKLRASGFEHVTPVFEDLDELGPFIDSGLTFNVGLRQKIDKKAHDMAGLDASNIRFGMNIADLHTAAQRIADAPNLTLVMYHAMHGNVSAAVDAWLTSFRAAMQVYADLARQHPSLHMFNWGGGFPAAVGELHSFDYYGFIKRLMGVALEVSQGAGITPPDLVGEYGRYTTAEHAFHLFKVLKGKDNGSRLPWYLIDGSVMSSFPDAWALGLEFEVLPLNHLDQPFREVKLGGLTCDTDDIYPTRPEHHPLLMPVDTDGLYIGVFGIGCYQEMLGGVRGVKHCLLPEANELIIGQAADGGYSYRVMPKQSYAEILTLLGYRS